MKITPKSILTLLLIITIPATSFGSTNKLKRSVKRNVKTVSISDIVFIDNPELEISTAATEGEQRAALIGGAIGGAAGGLIGGVIVSAKNANSGNLSSKELNDTINALLGDSVYQVVQQQVYEQAVQLSERFNMFEFNHKDSAAVDGKLVFAVDSYGYRRQDANIQACLKLTCYLIKNDNVQIKEQAEYVKCRRAFRDVKNYEVLWKETAFSAGQLFKFDSLSQNPSLVHDHYEDACRNTVNVLFCSMIGINAY